MRWGPDPNWSTKWHISSKMALDYTPDPNWLGEGGDLWLAGGEVGYKPNHISDSAPDTGAL